MMHTSIIISHKSRSEERLRNLRIVVKWLISTVRKSDKVELIIVEQGEKRTVCSEEFDNASLPIKCKFVYKKGLFNKSWGYNVGAKMASYNNLLFIDNDIILSREAIKRGYKLFKHVDAVRFYDRLYALSERETQALVERFEYPPQTSRILRDFSVPGGFFLIRKKLFYKLGGWNEEFEGWGGEDDAFAHKMSKHTVAAVTIPAFHLHHMSFGFNDDPSQFELVKKIFKKIKKLSYGRIVKLAKKAEIGLEEKYLNQKK